MNDNNEEFSGICELFEGLFDLAKTTLPFFKDFTDDVINERITRIKEIEWQLTNMLSFCFDEEILLLYKRILRKLYDKYPDIVEFYVQYYREMYEDGNSIESKMY